MYRIRSFLARNYVAVVVALVVLVAVGGWMTYTAHVAPGVTTTERSTLEWESTGEFSHRSTVVAENPVYETGTTLSNRSIYFTTITPEMDGAYTYTYSARERGSVDARVTLSVVLRSVADDGGQGRTLWETRRQLESRTVSDLEPGRTVRVPFTANVSAVENRSTRIRDALGTVGGRVRATVVADVRVRGRINGEAVNNSTQYRLPMRFEGRTYRVDDPGPVTASEESVRIVRQQRSYGLLRSLGGPLLLLGAAGGLAIVVPLRVRGRLSLTPDERARMEFRDARSDYGDRITTVRLPESVLDRPQAEVGSLEDLVHIAIDSGDAAVVEDPSTDAFYVVGADWCYVYTPPRTTQDATTSPDTDTDGAPPEQPVEAE